jgi:hypothetical protein
MLRFTLVAQHGDAGGHCAGVEPDVATNYHYGTYFAHRASEARYNSEVYLVAKLTQN